MIQTFLSASVRALRPLLFAGVLAGSASAHVTLLAPSGGEVLTVGETTTVRWRISIQHQLQNWDLHYSVTGANGPWTVIALDLPAGSPAAGSIHTYDWVVPDDVSNQVRVRVRMDNAGANYLGASGSNLSIVPCASPTTYCSTAPNSVGSGATIGWVGSPNVSTNAFTLTASGAPANKPALFFYSDTQVSTPFGEGIRCVGGSLSRLGVLLTDGSGQASHALDVNAPPANMGNGAINSGGTYNFQLWYRDPTGGPSGFNLTDGLSVTFCP